jgi:hypothetical protein
MLSVRLSPELETVPACAMVTSPARANCPDFSGHAKVALPPFRLKQPQPPGGALLCR